MATTRFAHVNIIVKDWRALSRFCHVVFGLRGYWFRRPMQAKNRPKVAPTPPSLRRFGLMQQAIMMTEAVRFGSRNSSEILHQKRCRTGQLPSDQGSGAGRR